MLRNQAITLNRKKCKHGTQSDPITDHDDVELMDASLVSDFNEAIEPESELPDLRLEDAEAVWYCCWVCMNMILNLGSVMYSQIETMRIWAYFW